MENYIRRENNMSEKQMTNDDKIMLLKSQIEDREKNLKVKKKFTPETNCSLEFEGVRYNLHASQKDQLTNLLIRLTMYEMAVEKLGLENEYIISGYSVGQWIKDIKLRLKIIKYEEEDRNLKDLKKKLENLLSHEKQVELAIDDLAKLIK